MSSTAYGDTLPAHHAEDSAQQHQPPPPSVPALTLTHQDLLNTANELYRRMEDPGFAQDDAYWTSLPVHLRNFIRNALPLAGNVSMGDGVLPGGVGKAGGQRAMYALAQQIVSAANTGMGAGVSAAAAAAAAAAAVSGVSYPNPGYAVGMASSQPPPPPPPPAPYASSTRQQGNVPTQQMSLDDIASMPPDAMLYPTADGQDVGKGYGFHPHPDHRQGPPHDHGEMVGQDGMDGWGNAKRGTMPGGFVRGDDDDLSEDSVSQIPMDGLTISAAAAAAQAEGNAGAGDGSGGKKKKKKKSKKGGMMPDQDMPPAQSYPPANAPRSAPSPYPPMPQSAPMQAHPSQQVAHPSHQVPQRQVQHVPSPPPPPPQHQHQHPHQHQHQQHQPQQPQSQQPVPVASSRAAGKQPMPYLPPHPAAQPTSNHAQPQSAAQQPLQQPVRSARSAGKAPVTSAPAPPLPPSHPQQQQPHHGHLHPGASSKQPAQGGVVSGQAGVVGGKGKPGASSSSVAHGSASANASGGGSTSPARVWQTSTAEERHQIKRFWLSLTPAERGDLLRIDKEVVLKKIKEQSRHSCACAVCGRKRGAIEEEVERLYRAYEESLERFAKRQREQKEAYSQQQQHQQQQQQQQQGQIPGGPFLGSVELDREGHVIHPDELAPRRARRVDHHAHAVRGVSGGVDLGDDDEDYDDDEDEEDEDDEDDEDDDEVDDEEDYEDEDEEEDLVDDEIDEPPTEGEDGEDEYDDGSRHHHHHSHHSHTHQHHHPHVHSGQGDPRKQPPQMASRHRITPGGVQRPMVNGEGARAPGEESDFYTFGDGLTTIKGGVLTVADDLLKNDSTRFLEMMEQLAERRMMREEAAIQMMEDGRDSGEQMNHDTEDGENEDDLDDEDDEDEDDEDDDDILTDEQRMEEGRRMFQIFAARLFEQRVHQAWKEKVHREQAEAFLRELENEQKQEAEAQARKAKEAQKKKDKKKAQKERQEADKRQRDVELAAEAAAVKAAKETAEREASKKREEERARKEAEKKARMEEAMRKEEEKKKRLAEEREREAERAKKLKEKEDRARVEREAREKERKEKEEKERLEKQAKEKQAKEEKARKAAEEEARKEKIRKDKEEREVREKEAQAAAQAQAAARLAAQQQAAAKKSAAIATQQQAQQQQLQQQQQQQAKATKAPRATATRQKSNTRASTPSASIPQPSTSGAPSQGSSSKSTASGAAPSIRPSTSNNAMRSNAPPLAMQGLQGVSSTQGGPQNLQMPPSQQMQQSQAPPPHMMPHMFSPTGPGPHMHNMPPLYVNGNLPHNGVNARQNVFNPHAMHLKGAPSPGVQNPFPQQVPGFGAPSRHNNMSMNSPAAAPGFNMPFGQQVGMNPVNSFTPAVQAGQNMLSQALSPETRNTTEQGAPSPFESNILGGMRTLGLGHPGKLGGKSTDDVFSPAASIGQTMPLRSQSSDQTTPQLTATTPDFRSNFARPDPIGPIEPIGRPRVVNGFETIDESTTSESNSRKSGGLGAPGPALGSAALSAGAEEVKDIPAPRRVSNTAALGGTWAPPSLSASTSWGPSPFAMAPGAGIWGGSTTTSQVDTPHWPTGTSANSSPFGKSKMTALPNSAQSTLTRGFDPVISAETPTLSSSSAFFSPMQSHHNTQLPLNNNPFGPPGQTTQQSQQQSVHHAQNQAQQPLQRLI